MADSLRDASNLGFHWPLFSGVSRVVVHFSRWIDESPRVLGQFEDSQAHVWQDAGFNTEKSIPDKRDALRVEVRP